MSLEQPPVPQLGGAAAMTARAYDGLRRAIANGEFAPGTWLREPVVAAALGLSRTPVREALRMLAAEGVVELVHNRGARVVEWSAVDIDEIYQLRALLEGHGAALAARDASPAQVTELRQLAERYERAVGDVDAAGVWAQCNNAFHAAVVEASGSTRLRTLLDVISSTPLVTQALQRYSADDRRRSVLQHRDIVTAIAHGDASLAEAAMRSHILAARYTARHLANVGDEQAE